MILPFRKPPLARLRPILATAFALLATLSSSAAVSEDPVVDTGPLFLDMAMTKASMGQINRNQAIAAYETYATAYARAAGFEAIVAATIFDDADDLLAASLRGENQVLGLQVQDYFHIRQQVPLDLVFLSRHGGRPGATYVLLVRDDSEITDLAQLRDRSLIRCESLRMGLAAMWLEVLLSENGLGPSQSLLQSIKICDKISKAVIPVLLGKADACLVTQSGFETMAELNPQIARQLRVLASSPPVVPFVTCMRSDFTGINRQRTEKAYVEADLTPEGRQVLTLFGDDGV